MTKRMDKVEKDQQGLVEAMAKQYETMNLLGEKVKTVKTIVNKLAVKCTIDRKGRISIDEGMRDGLNKIEAKMDRVEAEVFPKKELITCRKCKFAVDKLQGNTWRLYCTNGDSAQCGFEILFGEVYCSHFERTES